MEPLNNLTDALLQSIKERDVWITESLQAYKQALAKLNVKLIDGIRDADKSFAEDLQKSLDSQARIKSGKLADELAALKKEIFKTE